MAGLLLVESWQKKESRLLYEHNAQVAQLSDELHERDLQIKQYETDMQVSVSGTLHSSRRKGLDIFCTILTSVTIPEVAAD